MTVPFYPWATKGVSTYPVRLPMVGQSRVYEALRRFVEEDADLDPLAGFFLVVGGWGTGKSRLGHQLLAEATGHAPDWVLGEENGTLQKGHIFRPCGQDQNLVLYVQYRDLISTRMNRNTWYEEVALGALTNLVKLPRQGSMGYAYYLDLVSLLKEKGLDRERLSNGLLDQDVPADNRVRQALTYLKEIGFTRLQIIVDEVETLGDEDLRPDPQEDESDNMRVYLKTIGMAIKNDDYRSRWRNLNFILLCSPGSRAKMDADGANARRMLIRNLEKLPFAHLMLYYRHLEELAAGYNLTLQYPPGLVETAFFAAGRNMGWFNIIMHNSHQKLTTSPDVTVDVLMRDYMDLDDGRIFEVTPIEMVDRRGLSRADQVALEQVLYRQIPTRLQNLDISPQTLERIRKVQYPKAKEAISELIPVSIDLFSFTSALKTLGFRNGRRGAELQREELFIEPKELLDSFRAFSVGLEGDGFLAYTSYEEFAAQIAVLYPKDTIDQVARQLHAIFLDNRVPGGDTYIGPSFRLLQDVNRLWATVAVSTPVFGLKDKEKSAQIEEEAASFTGLDMQRQILRGLAKVMDMQPLGRITDDLRTRVDFKSPRLILKPDFPSLNLNQAERVILLYHQSTENTIADLGSVKDTELCPVVVVLPSEGQRVDLERALEQDRYLLNHIYFPFVVESGSNGHRFLLHYSLRDDRFQYSEMLEAVVEERFKPLRNRLSSEAEAWRKQREDEGWILLPLYQTKNDARTLPPTMELALRQMAMGKAYDDLVDQHLELLETKQITELQKILQRCKEGGINRVLPVLVEDQSGVRLKIPALWRQLLRHLSVPKSTTGLSERFYYKKGEFTADRALHQNLEIMVKLGLIKEDPTEHGNQYEASSQRAVMKELEDAKKLLNGYLTEVKMLEGFYPPATLTGLWPESLKPLLLRVDQDLEAARTLPFKQLTSPEAQDSDLFTIISGTQRIQALLQQIRPDWFPRRTDIREDNAERLLPSLEIEFVERTVYERIETLKDLRLLLVSRAKEVMQSITVTKGNLHRYNSVGERRPFPTAPALSLLQQIADDAGYLAEGKGEAGGLVLGPELQALGFTETIRSLLHNKQFSTALAQLRQYHELAGEGDSGVLERHVALFKRWAALARAYDEAQPKLDDLRAYFTDTSNAIRANFTAAEASLSDLGDLLESLSETLRTGDNSLSRLESEVAAAEAAFTTALGQAESARRNAEEQLLARVDHDAVAALNAAARRTTGRAEYPNLETWLRAFPTYNKQRSERDDLQSKISTRGQEICGSDELWQLYRRLYRQLVLDHDEGLDTTEHTTALQELAERNVVGLTMRPEVRF